MSDNTELFFFGFGKTAEKYTWKECHAWKCVHRCKELAEKFKTKSTAL